MMYFTECDPESCANATDLNGRFEARYDETEYEAKIGKLLHHAYKRLKSEDRQNARVWDEAIRVLEEGDHYLLVFWKEL